MAFIFWIVAGIQDDILISLSILSFNANIESTESNPVHLQEAIAFDFHCKAFKDVWTLWCVHKMEKELQWKMGALKNWRKC